jgi:cytochrome c-type biogenesis protein
VKTGIGLLIAFGAGFTSFISPCVLPLIPGYLSFITGLSLEELKHKDHASQILLSALVFVLGFSLVFVLLGTSASVAGSLLIRLRPVLNRFAGVFVILMGLLVLGALKVPFLQRERRFHLAHSWGKLGTLLLGMAFAFAWTPCVGPILSTILMFAASVGSASKGAALLFSYSLGLGIPFILSAIALERLVTTFAWIKRHYRLINAISGSLLIVMGILLFTGQLTYVSIILQRIIG